MFLQQGDDTGMTPASHMGLGQVERIDFEDGRYATFTYDALERLTTEQYLTKSAA